MRATHKGIVRISARVLGTLKMITVLRARMKEVAMAKVIVFYIPTNFRSPMKWVSELDRGKVVEFSPHEKKTA